MYPRNDEGFKLAFMFLRSLVRTHKRAYKMYVGAKTPDQY
jgi:hypothetical protein